MKQLFFLITVLLVTGCVRTKQTTLIEADEGMVKNCKFAGSVEGSSGLALEYAQKDAMTRAAKKGATHIIFLGNSRANYDARLGSGQFFVQARGYQCAQRKDSTDTNEPISSKTSQSKTKKKKKE